MLEVKKDEGAKCISCCEGGKSARQVSINRKSGTYKDSNIVTFHLCNDCLRTLAKEFVPYS